MKVYRKALHSTVLLVTVAARGLDSFAFAPAASGQGWYLGGWQLVLQDSEVFLFFSELASIIFTGRSVMQQKRHAKVSSRGFL